MHLKAAAAIALLVVLAAGAIFGSWWFERRRDSWAAAAASAEASREARSAPITEVAPAPMPTKLPLLGPEGVDDEGFPRAYVDRPALRSLLIHAQYGALSGYLKDFVDAVDQDEKRERWAFDGFDAFDSAEPALGTALDAWVEHEKGSFAAHLARARHRIAVAFARRGWGWARDVPSENLQAMHELFAAARGDLDEALALRPKLLVVHRYRLIAASAEGDGAAKLKARDDALAICPRCVEIRWSYLVQSTPRWGGSYAEMDAFARASQAIGSPSRTRPMLGATDWDRASLARHDKDLDVAAAAIERALGFGERWSFLLERGRVRTARGDAAGALADLDRARDLRPGDPGLLFHRASVLLRLNRYEDAGHDLLEGLRVDPTDDVARAIFQSVKQGLVKEAFAEDRAGHRDAALRVYDLAAEIAPLDRDVLGRRARAIIGSDHPDPKVLEKAIAEHPDDFRLHQQLDYVLAKEGAFPRIAEMWDAYLARHPSDARAYLERGGTQHHLGHDDLGRRDALKACELGLNEGCAMAKRLGAR